jgi:hypothetical protein
MDRPHPTKRASEAIPLERGLKASISAKSGIVERTAAANEIRILLEGIKAVLWEKARKWPKENMTWEMMAERLAKKGPGGTEYHELLSQEAKYLFLFGLLSSVGKDREGKSLNDIENIWAQTLDHIFTVLGLIKS